MRSRNFCLILYPESEEHVKALEVIKNQFSYAYILHNKDIWEKDEIDPNTKEIKHKKGEPKKEHWHIIIATKNARSKKTIAEILNLEENYIQTTNFYEMARYLIHKGYPYKYQYTKEEIITNMKERIENAIERDINAEEEKARILLDFIFNQENQGIMTFRKLTEYAMEKDCLIELQKKSYFYNQFCDNIGFRRI